MMIMNFFDHIIDLITNINLDTVIILSYNHYDSTGVSKNLMCEFKNNFVINLYEITMEFNQCRHKSFFADKIDTESIMNDIEDSFENDEAFFDGLNSESVSINENSDKVGDGQNVTEKSEGEKKSDGEKKNDENKKNNEEDKKTEEDKKKRKKEKRKVIKDLFSL